MVDVITEYVGLEGYIKQLLVTWASTVKSTLQINPSVDSHSRFDVDDILICAIAKISEKLKVI